MPVSRAAHSSRGLQFDGHHTSPEGDATRDHHAKGSARRASWFGFFPFVSDAAVETQNTYCNFIDTANKSFTHGGKLNVMVS